MRLLVSFGVVVALAAGGCGTTTIVAGDPGARIFADGRLLGRGQGQLTRRGPPGGTTVVVRTDDGRQEQTIIKRQFTALTLLGGLFTYGICLIACWEYPDMVAVPMASAYHPYGAPPFPGAPAGYAPPPVVDPWLQPPGGYAPPVSQAPQPPASQ
jgi:hypothetical protein